MAKLDGAKVVVIGGASGVGFAVAATTASIQLLAEPTASDLAHRRRR